MHRGRQVTLFSDDGDHHVDAGRDSDLRLHGVLRDAVAVLRPQMMLDPIEELLDLPTRLVQCADIQGRRQRAVSREHQALVDVRTAITDPPQVGWIASRSRAAIERHRIHSSRIEVALGARDKGAAGLVVAIEPLEGQIAAIHDVERARLWQRQIKHVDVVKTAISDVNKTGNRAAQVQQGAELHDPLGATEAGPREYRQTQIAGSVVQRVDRAAELHAGQLAGVALAGTTHQRLRELGIDAPVAALVGIGQSGTSYRLTQPHLIELAGLRGETALDIERALPRGGLGEGHDTRLLGARQRADPMVALIAAHNAVEDCPWQKVHDPCKQYPGGVHRRPRNPCPATVIEGAKSWSTRYHLKMAVFLESNQASEHRSAH